jgi:hypothetical protein
MIPEIVENYRSFTPAKDLGPTVRMLLEYVPVHHLAGVRFIELTNSTVIRERRRGKTWSRGKRVRFSECLGLYCGDHVELFVDEIIQTPPTWVWRVPVLRAMWIGSVLFHEIGHHIHFTQRPEHREREDVADEWKKRLMRGFLRKRYWYLVPVWKPVAWIVRQYARYHLVRSHGGSG